MSDAAVQSAGDSIALRETPIYAVGSRSILLLGCDRTLVMVGAMLSFLIPFSTNFAPWADLTGIILWFVMLYFLRQMGKADPLMRQVFIRQNHYRSFYPARSTPFCTARHRYI